MSRPSGMLTAPAEISDETAKRLKESFEQNFAGSNLGRLFVAGDSLKYEPITINAVDAQLIEQLRWTVEDVARAFRVPLHMLNAGPAPQLNSVEAIEQSYYRRTLQAQIEAIEQCLDAGLDLAKGGMHTEFDLDGLLRMDSAAMYEALGKGVGGGWLAPNEARARMNLPPVEGGASPLAQQQNFSLAALAKRDAKDDPFDTGGGGGGGVTRSGLRRLITKDQRSMDELQELVAAEVAKALAALPRPQPGEPGPQGDKGEDGRDGVDGRDMDADTANVLVAKHVEARLDGLVEKLHESAAAKWALDFERRAADVLARAVDRLPRPADGKDGLTPDDLVVELKDERTLVVGMHAAGRSIVREITLRGLPVERGVHKHGQAYQAGDLVTYTSSYWICLRNTTQAPGTDDWRMVMRGRKQ